MKTELSSINYAQLIDHTYLKPTATTSDIDKLIREAKKYHFKTVCVNGTWTKYVSKKLQGTSIGLTIVVGFPLGASTTATKLFEAHEAISNGANEIDMVMNIGWLKKQKYNNIINEIKKIKQGISHKLLKVIIECSLLSAEEIAKATELVIKGGGDFVKTSTGFSSRGAIFSDIEIMQRVAKGKIGIKASGGIKSFYDLEKMVNLGATRIGTSSGVQLLQGHLISSTSY